MRGSKLRERLERSFFKDCLRRLGARHPQAKWTYYLFQFLLFEGLNYVENCARNSVKVLIGRKPYFSDQHIFFRQYLRHLLGIQPIKVTSFTSFASEGAGWQALNTMRAITFARACGLTYVHTPFTTIGHADRPMPLWVDAWEAQFNFGMGEELAAKSDNREIVNVFGNYATLAPLFGFFNGHDFARKVEETIPEFRRKYYWNKTPIQSELLTICVHIRRGDIKEDRLGTFISTSVFKKVLSEVRVVLNARRIRHRVQIFTLGDLSDFDVQGVEIFSDVDAIWSMQQMIEADIFIMSKSFFSYVAATISDGIKIKIGEGFFIPLSGWIVVDSNCEFDRVAFDAQLVQHIEAKTSKQGSSKVIIPG